MINEIKIQLVITCPLYGQELKTQLIYTDIKIENKVLAMLGYCMEEDVKVQVSLVFTRCLQMT